MNEKIIIGKGTKYPLNGILSLPDNCTSMVPAVVLVHGSGPADMDESIGANKPFRDIAEALSAQGIAVLRVDKRTKIYGKQMLKESPGNVTVEGETIEDAILAAKLLKNDRRTQRFSFDTFQQEVPKMIANLPVSLTSHVIIGTHLQE